MLTTIITNTVSAFGVSNDKLIKYDMSKKR